MMKKRLTLASIASMLLVLLLAGCVGVPDILSLRGVTGSGNVVEQRFDLRDFTSVQIENAFVGSVTQGEEWRVLVSADDNIMPDVQVSVEGGTLHVGLKPEIQFGTKQLRVEVTMPTLDAITINGASRIALDGFARTPSFVATVTGASELTGAASADTLSITISGAGEVTLTGEGTALLLRAAGASRANLAELTVATADVTLTGASSANVTASQSIDLEAAGASNLTYGGGATLASSQISGASQAHER